MGKGHNKAKTRKSEVEKKMQAKRTLKNLINKVLKHLVKHPHDDQARTKLDALENHRKNS